MRNRIELARYFNKLGFKKGAEIGVDRGYYSHVLLENISGLELLCIDSWDTTKKRWREGRYHAAMKELSEYPNAKIIRKSSREAVRDIPDKSLDFVFIDGNHSYSYVLEDITEWTKKVKPGGIVCGHDYKVDPTNDYGVIEAVQKYTKDNHIAPWFILHAGGRLVDCWMIIKQ